MRKSFKTTEFWVVLAASLLAVVQQQLWPDAPFPTEAFIALGLWVGARVSEKTLGDTNTEGKRAWQTGEFWLAIAFAAAKSFFPDIPDTVLYGIAALILGRPLIKVTKDFSISSVFKKTG